MKAYTDIDQSKKLAELLPIESADMWYCPYPNDVDWYNEPNIGKAELLLNQLPCWSLAALLEYMNRNFYNVSLSYCGSKYTISFDDSETYKTITKDYSIDAAFEMICWLKETNRI